MICTFDHHFLENVITSGPGNFRIVPQNWVAADVVANLQGSKDTKRPSDDSGKIIK
jgi:hypothetical protein